MVKNHPKLSVQFFVKSISEFPKQKRNYFSTCNAVQSDISCLQWTRLLMKYCSKELDEFELLGGVILAQAYLLYSITSVSSNKSTWQKILFAIWIESPSLLEVYADNLLKLEPSVDIELML